jgi:ribonuclease HII
VASGTATLEAALLRCPHVIAYRMSPTTYRMMKSQGYLPYVGLPNILAGEWLVPELLQEDATPKNLARALGNWLIHKDAAARLRDRFAGIHAALAVDNAVKIRDALRPFLTRAAKPAATSAPPAVCARICGVDEAGRGPLAGAVFAAAVILDPARPIAGLADSKTLSEKRRDCLALLIREQSLACCVASASVEEIDAINILQASLLAMKRAIEGLTLAPDEIVVDGLHLPKISLRSRALVQGDRLMAEISAASILAKTARDAEMRLLDACFPEYGFARHKGYGTAAHLHALKMHGPCAIHRRSFAPVRIAAARALPA